MSAWRGVWCAAVLAAAHLLCAGQVWQPTASLPVPLSDPTTVLLSDGKVLVAGGMSLPADPGVPGTPAIYPLTAQIFDPKTQTFTPTGKLHFGRYEAAGALLPDGDVLIVGGSCVFCTAPNLVSPPPEIYHAATGNFSLVTGAVLPAPRSPKTTALEDGTVLVTGSGAAWVFDPASATFSSAGSVLAADNLDCQLRLADGDVLLVGGLMLGQGVSPNAPPQIYHTATRQWQTLGNFPLAWSPSCTLLPGGKVLIAGGYSQQGDIVAALFFDPETLQFTSAPAPPVGTGGTAFWMPSGRLYIPAGFSLWYDPGTETFSPASVSPNAKVGANLVQLADGRILALGGEETNGTPITSAEIFSETPAAPFSLSVPAQASIASGFGSVPISTTATGTLTGPISLSCFYSRFRATCSFTPNAVAAGQSASMSLGSISGQQTMEVVGTSGPYSAWAPVSVQGPELALGNLSSAQTVAAGAAATYTLSLFSVDSFPVSLTCSNLPPFATCSFNPSRVVVDAEGIRHDMLSISTTGRGVSSSAIGLGATGCALGAAAVLLLLGSCTSARRRVRVRLAGLVVLAAAALACGGVPTPPGQARKPLPAATGTPPGAYTVTVTGSWSSPGFAPVTAQTQVTLTVQ